LTSHALEQPNQNSSGQQNLWSNERENAFGQILRRPHRSQSQRGDGSKQPNRHATQVRSTQIKAEINPRKQKMLALAAFAALISVVVRRIL
jgi:hypothetical protein